MASPTSENNHRIHAEHNFKVYTHLREDLTFIDWIITTAFYSALHYVEAEIFPMTIEIAGKKHHINSTQEYKEYSGKRSTHGTRIKAVKKKLPGCKVAFSQLYDLCMTARYHQYRFDRPKELDKKVEDWLFKIKDECS